jgi:hypothetical protein
VAAAREAGGEEQAARKERALDGLRVLECCTGIAGAY